MNVSQENTAVLLIDNHESHLSVQSINLAKEHGLFLLTFPPHCSHRLQPLDISVYGPFKRYYNCGCNDWLLNHPGRPMSIYDVAGVSAQAYYKAFTPENIVSGFKKSGIFPFNRNVFTDDDFLPVLPVEASTELPAPSTSTELPVPSTSTELPVPSTSTELPVPSTSGSGIGLQQTLLRVSDQSKPVSPEVVRAFPKLCTVPQKPNRKKKQSSILTDHDPNPVFKDSTRHEVETKSQSSSARQTIDSCFQQKIPESGDYVLIQYTSSRSGPLHYVGQVLHQNDEISFCVRSFRRSQRHAPDYAFVEPLIEDITYVNSEFLKVLPRALPQTTKRLQGILQFAFNFESYNVQ